MPSSSWRKKRRRIETNESSDAYLRLSPREESKNDDENTPLLLDEKKNIVPRGHKMQGDFLVDGAYGSKYGSLEENPTDDPPERIVIHNSQELYDYTHSLGRFAPGNKGHKGHRRHKKAPTSAHATFLRDTLRKRPSPLTPVDDKQQGNTMLSDDSSSMIETKTPSDNNLNLNSSSVDAIESSPRMPGKHEHRTHVSSSQMDSVKSAPTQGKQESPASPSYNSTQDVSVSPPPLGTVQKQSPSSPLSPSPTPAAPTSTRQQLPKNLPPSTNHVISVERIGVAAPLPLPSDESKSDTAVLRVIHDESGRVIIIPSMVSHAPAVKNNSPSLQQLSTTVNPPPTASAKVTKKRSLFYPVTYVLFPPAARHLLQHRHTMAVLVHTFHYIGLVCLFIFLALFFLGVLLYDIFLLDHNNDWNGEGSHDTESILEKFYHVIIFSKAGHIQYWNLLLFLIFLVFLFVAIFLVLFAIISLLFEIVVNMMQSSRQQQQQAQENRNGRKSIQEVIEEVVHS